MPKRLTRRDLEWEYQWARHHRAHHLLFTFSTDQFTVEGNHMTFTLKATEGAKVKGRPVNINGEPSPATLSDQVYSSSDTAVFTVEPDPDVPGGAIVRGTGVAGTATLLETATATEPDGVTTNQVQNVATFIFTLEPPPPPLPAVSLEFEVGEPFPLEP